MMFGYVAGEPEAGAGGRAPSVHLRQRDDGDLIGGLGSAQRDAMHRNHTNPPSLQRSSITALMGWARRGREVLEASARVLWKRRYFAGKRKE